MDALSLLRNETIAGRKVEKQGDLLLFGQDFASPCTAETNYRARTTDKLYTIEAIWFLLQRPGLDHGRYLLEAKKLNIPPVARADRKDVLAYVKGEVATSDQIDPTAFVPTVLGRAEAEAASSAKRPADAGPAEATPSKRIRQDKDKTASAGQAAVESEAAAPATSGASLSRASMMERDAKTKKILDLELRYDNRITSLLSSKKFDMALAYLDNKPDKSEGKRGAQPSSVLGGTARKPMAAYDRYDQPAAKAQGAEFGINEAGAFVAQEAPEAEAATTKPKRKPKTNRTPIIIVPSGLKDAITLHNVQGYLEQGTVIPTAEAAKQSRGRPQHVIVNKKRGSVTRMYKVVDNVATMTPEHWDRVVACFVSGPEWQFKRWPMYEAGGTAELFSKVRGFYVYYGDQKIHPNVANWDVTRLLISRNKPHLDKTTSLKFWEVLDAHTKKKHPDLKL
eukprot:m.77498 g.77498  ORF g.77498 m.77498 type:complete len:451 (-) comp9145_c0_seq1:101-1453(-)